MGQACWLQINLQVGNIIKKLEDVCGVSIQIIELQKTNSMLAANVGYHDDGEAFAFISIPRWIRRTWLPSTDEMLSKGSLFKRRPFLQEQGAWTKLWHEIGHAKEFLSTEKTINYQKMVVREKFSFLLCGDVSQLVKKTSQTEDLSWAELVNIIDAVIVPELAAWEYALLFRTNYASKTFDPDNDLDDVSVYRNIASACKTYVWPILLLAKSKGHSKKFVAYLDALVSKQYPHVWDALSTL